MTTAEKFARLSEQLGGRAPVYRREPLLEPGRVMWDTAYLPQVFVAPDVYEALMAPRPRVTPAHVRDLKPWQ
jgi:hypothetical protein